MPVGINVGHVRHVLDDSETALLLREFHQNRPERDPVVSESVAEKIQRARVKDSPSQTVELTRSEMGATRQALWEIGREVGRSGEFQHLAELSRGLRLEMESWLEGSE